MRSILTIIDRISEWSSKSIAYLVVVTAFLVVIEVVMRYAFNSPTVWNIDLVTYLCMALYFLGGAWVLSTDMHVRVDILYVRLSPRTKAILDIVTVPFFLAFCGVLLWFGSIWMWASLIKGQTSGTQWDILIWPVKTILPLATLLLLLQGLAKLARDFRTALGGTNNER